MLLEAKQALDQRDYQVNSKRTSIWIEEHLEHGPWTQC